jgi:hypothetical protein
MIADEMSGSGSGSDPRSILLEITADDEKCGLGLETLQDIQDLGSVHRMRAVVEGKAHPPTIPFPEYLSQEGSPGVGNLM